VNLTGRVVLITGARRIGGSVARALGERGADVALSYYRSREEAERVAEAVRAGGQRAFVRQTDLTVAAECAQLIDDTVAALGRLDVLINMASRYVETPFDELGEAVWDLDVGVDLKAAFLCSLAAAPHLRKAGGGQIINFSDWLSRSGRPRYPGYLTYYVAKTGVVGLTEALALELAPDNILVNAIAAGPIRAVDDLEASELEAVARVTPLGRWGGDQAIVQAVISLLDCDFVTGETVRVDGGRHLR